MILLTRKVTRHKVHIKVDSVDVKCCHSHTDLVCISIGNMKTHIFKNRKEYLMAPLSIFTNRFIIIHSYFTNTQYRITDNNCNLIYLDLMYADFGNVSKLLSHLLHN